MDDIEFLPTIGTIARLLGVEQHRVEYIVRSRGIQPAGRAGMLRIFDEAGIEQIRQELEAADHVRASFPQILAGGGE